MILFEKDYDGESLYDFTRDMQEVFEPAFTPSIASIPQDEHGFQLGTFRVKVEWIPEGEKA